MDSLTQLTFGAACGEAILGQKVGRKALVWGAVKEHYLIWMSLYPSAAR